MSEGEGEGAPPPNQTATLIGHEAAEVSLLQAFASGRQHHAVMLAGDRGIGKATLAYRFARFVFAHPDPAATAVSAAVDLAVDPASRAARLVGHLSHPDLTVLSAASFAEENKSGEIKVAHVRWAIGRLATTADGDGWRICIVDAADDLNRNAANALLKALEEPPARTLFLLVAHRPGRLLATIRSRCLRIDMKPLAHDAARTAVTGAMPAMVGRTDLGRLVEIAGGSPGLAIELAEVDGLAVHDAVGELFAALPRLDGAALHALADQMSGQRADRRFRLFMDMLIERLGNEISAMARAGGHHPSLGPRARLEPWMELWDNLTRAYDETLALNLNRKNLILNTGFGLEGVARKARAAI